MKRTDSLLTFHGGSTNSLLALVYPREMGTIAEDVLTPVDNSDWSNDQFELNEEGQVRNRQTKQRLTKDERRDHGEEVLKGLITHVHTRMLHECMFIEQAIPALEFDRASVDSDFSPGMSMSSRASSVRSSSSSICSTADGFRMMVDTDVPRCIFHTSQNFGIAEKLLVFVCSSRGLSCGIWSRTLLLDEGVAVGSMIPYFQAAIKAGYGVLVMNPNTNTQRMVVGPDGETEKQPIHGSSTQEEHCDHVWKNYIFPSAAHKIHFIAFGYGGQLVANLVEQYKYELKNRLGNVAYIESTHKIDPKWNSNFKRFFSQHSICWKRSDEPLDTDLGSLQTDRSSGGTFDTETSLAASPSSAQISAFGCICLSAGPGEGKSSSPAYTCKAVMETVFKFIESPNAYEYQRTAARNVRLNMMRVEEDQIRASSRVPAQPLPRRGSPHAGSGSNKTQQQSQGRSYDSVNIDDFELMRVVGRGAFGKVMLVRKKSGDASPAHAAPDHSGKVYAMKVIKKSAVFERNQVEHTKTERRILQNVDHPFLVKLRYAFQNDAKLYFVMDYYNGGTLHFHLRRAVHFDEPRTRFYASQMVLALSHLHTYNIVYRDLKSENILLDDRGFIAITDFGLSRDNVDSKKNNGGLSTFCGTPEYIAPELIRRIPYGKSADYWSLGILIYEMLAGYTPFYNANRKRNFENIVKAPLRIPGTFSDEARTLLNGLLCKDPAKRLGSGPTGAQEIMDHPFFAPVDWEKLFKREVSVPFRPIVRGDGEVNNIPEFFKRQDVVDSAGVDAPINKRHVFKDFSYVDPYQL